MYRGQGFTARTLTLERFVGLCSPRLFGDSGAVCVGAMAAIFFRRGTHAPGAVCAVVILCFSRRALGPVMLLLARSKGLASRLLVVITNGGTDIMHFEVTAERHALAWLAFCDDTELL